jgi:hypothetical protein
MTAYTSRFTRQIIIPTSIIISSLLLSIYWVFLIPIFQSPDEDQHCDYVFSLYSREKLFRAASAPIVACSHPYVRYLFDITNGQTLKLLPYAQLPADYGTKNFFQRLDADAPTKQMVDQCNTNPSDAVVYPFVYFALTAFCLKVLSIFNSNLSFLFYGIRLFSVILYGIGLVFSYLTLGELKLSRLKSSLILLAVSFFPMVTFQSAYVQPNNMSLAIISALFYFSLRWRNKTSTTPCSSALVSPVPELTLRGSLKYEASRFWLIASLIGFLFVKYQFLVSVGFPILAMIMTKSLELKVPIRNLIARAIILTSPAIALVLVQIWLGWGSHLPAIDQKHAHWHPTYTSFLLAVKKGLLPLFTFLDNAILATCNCFYGIDGEAFRTFWGSFGHSSCGIPLVIIDPSYNFIIRIVIWLLTRIIILFILLSLVKVLISLFRLAKKARLLKAAVIAFSNPLINSYLLYDLIIFACMVLAYPSTLWQGRHWFALMFPLVLTTACFAPRFFRSRKARDWYFYIVVTAWVIYSLVGSIYAVDCIQKRYYVPARIKPVNTHNLRLKSIDAPNTFHTLDYLDRYPSFDVHPDDYNLPEDPTYLVVPAGADIWSRGKVVDPETGSAASNVLLYIDGTKMCQAVYGLKIKTDNEKERYCGFEILIPTKDMIRGRHNLILKFISADGQTLYSVNQQIKIVIE